jgi:predicted ribosome quality control (RQC) complex YloA/Tae2 family protein
MAELSGLEVAVLVREINSELTGSYVSKVYSIGESQILRLRTKGGEDRSLVVSPHYGAWLTSNVSTHTKTSEFTSKLRSELERKKLEKVGQLDLDRIYVFSFEGKAGGRSLLLELIPPGNLLVLDGDNRIVLGLRELRTGGRQSRWQVYRPPAQTRVSPDQITIVGLKEILARESTLGKALGRGVALPRKYIDEVLRRYSLRQEDSSTLDEERIKELVKAITEILTEVRDHPNPSIVSWSRGDEVIAVTPAQGGVVREGGMSELVDQLFSSSLIERVKSGKQTQEQTKIREMEKTLEGLKRDSSELRDHSTRLRDLAANVQNELERNAIEDRLHASKDLPLNDVIQRLAVGASGPSLASEIFSIAKDAEERRAKIDAAAETIEKRLTRGRKQPHLEQLVPIQVRLKVEWYQKFHWFFTPTGRLAVGGRDAHSNSMLLKRHLDADDVVYHADLFGSPFFVLKGGKAQTEEEIRQVAQATVTFSSAWKSALASADAYWVFPDQVSSTAPSGEYLPKGSFMIRGKKNFVRNNLVQLAVGITSSGTIISGSAEAISKSSIGYLLLEPHREKSSDTAKKVRNELGLLAGVGLIRGTTLDDVLRVLPNGGGKIVRRRTARGIATEPSGR